MEVVYDFTRGGGGGVWGLGERRSVHFTQWEAQCKRSSSL